MQDRPVRFTVHHNSEYCDGGHLLLVQDGFYLCLYPRYCMWMWTGSSVGIETDYGLDGPGSNPGGDEIFRPSRPALGPTQLPVNWIPVLSRG